MKGKKEGGKNTWFCNFAEDIVKKTESVFSHMESGRGGSKSGNIGLKNHKDDMGGMDTRELMG